jgi:nucleoside-diphosphate-sugar epimerase
MFFSSEDRVLVTGSSGFIGTNLSDLLVRSSISCALVDINYPRFESHLPFFHRVDIRDETELQKLFSEYKPTHVVNLAARTDLLGVDRNDYSTNIEGTKNICNACIIYSDYVRRVVFVSSMLVCKVGYIPNGPLDFCPPNAYGESKVEGERIIRGLSSDLPDFRIVRPSSIWGPWFGEPYKNFFDAVIKRRFVKIQGVFSKKTFGYVENTVHQIVSLAKGNCQSSELLYTGDPVPLNINDWAEEIRKRAGIGNLFSLPFTFFWLAAKFGDVLTKNDIKFPMTTFRLNNMTTSNVIPVDLIVTKEVEFLDTRYAIDRTLLWLKEKG